MQAVGVTGLVLASQGRVSRFLLDSRGPLPPSLPPAFPALSGQMHPLALGFCPLCLNLKAPHTQHPRESSDLAHSSRLASRSGGGHTPDSSLAPLSPPAPPSRWHQTLSVPCARLESLTSASYVRPVPMLPVQAFGFCLGDASTLPAGLPASALCPSVCPVSHPDPCSRSPAPKVSARLRVSSRAWYLCCSILEASPVT